MKKLFRKMRRGLTLTNKLVLMFIALSMVPVIIVGFVSTAISGNILKDKEIARRTEELLLIDKEISHILKDIDLTAINYKIDPNVQKLFTQFRNIDRYEVNVLKFEIEKLIFTYSHQHNFLLDSTYIFSLDGLVCSNESVVNVTLNDYYQRDWFKKGMESGQSKFFGDAELIKGRRVIPYVRRITSVDNNRTIGFIVLNINEVKIRSAYLYSFPSSSASMMIVNDNDVILSHTERKYIGKKASESFESQSELNEKNFEYNFQGRKMLVISSKSQKNDWTYYSIVPMSHVNASSAIIYRITLALMGAVVAFIVFLSYFLSKQVTHPIRELSNVMREAETGNLNVTYSGNNYDEIGRLGESFNKMTKKLKLSMEETLSVQKEKMEAELKGLEFQINPHFLYNTLSSIIWLADEGKNDEVINVTKSLATFFRISISRGKEIIRVSDEIEHVINYMEIQKTRYDDVMFVHDIDMEIRGLYTLKLLLQPIIENAIYHGVKTIKHGRGIIKLSAKKEKDSLIFDISDNGNTMTEQRAQELNQALDGKENNDLGVGLVNVNNRIKLHFGQGYGLKFKVVEGYTVAEIRVPIIESEERNDV